MGGGEESPLAKPSKSNPTTQDNIIPPAYPDWSSSMQAYYGGGATPPFFATNVAPPTPHPYMWGPQHAFIPPYGTPVPYPALYPPAGVYAHPSVAQAPIIVPTNMETEGNAPNGKDQTLSKKLKASTGGGKAGSGPGHDGATQSLESGSEGSKDTSNGDGNQGYTHMKGGQMLVDGANSQSNPVGKNTQASTAGNPILLMPGRNLNIGMDLWNANSTNDGTSRMRPNSSGHSQAPVVRGEDFMTKQWIHEDRDLRREKRKQSNRESARRSRLRKQAECEELQAKVDKLSSENQTLRDELQRLSEESQKLTSENNFIKVSLGTVNVSEAESDFEIDNADPLLPPHNINNT